MALVSPIMKWDSMGQHQMETAKITWDLLFASDERHKA